MKGAGDTLDALAFFGGGTGGHLHPGVAVAERAVERFPGCSALFFCTRRPVEERILAASRFPSRRLPLTIPSRSAVAWLRYTAQSLRAVRQLRPALRGKFDAVFGLGGYASLPGVLAARREGIPVVLLEQNLVPGRVNRLMARFCSAVACPHPKVAQLLGGRAEFTGNPVRRLVLEAAETRNGRVRPERQTVLVVGGSQGAQGINRALESALPELLDFREKISWIHLTGTADKERVAASYRQGGWQAEVREWAQDLPKLMAESDLVLARAGGTTLAELAVLGVPAVLVPYPYHSDRHQLRNALVYAESGGALMVPQEELGAETLRRIFEEVLFSPPRLREMAAGLGQLARPGAADAIIDLVLELKRATCPRLSVCSS